MHMLSPQIPVKGTHSMTELTPTGVTQSGFDQVFPSVTKSGLSGYGLNIRMTCIGLYRHPLFFLYVFFYVCCFLFCPSPIPSPFLLSSTNPLYCSFSLFQFLVGMRGKDEAMAIGGHWSPSLDGADPEKDASVLIKTAIRCCKALTGIDLSLCTQW